MASTSIFGLPSPDTGDLATVPAHMGALADAIEQIMLAIYPLGIGHPFFGAADDVPDNFVIFDGRAISRSTYARLYAALGTTHGVGDGSLTFNLPDMRGRVPAGVDAGAGRISANNQPGQSGGAQSVALTQAQMPSHYHIGASHQHIVPAHYHSINLNTGIESQPHAHNFTGGAVNMREPASGLTRQVLTNSGVNGTGNNLSNHVHNVSGNTGVAPDVWSGPPSAVDTGSAGSNQPHNNLQPYINCIWIGWSGNLPTP